MNLLRYTAIALAGLVVIPIARVDAGSEKVAFPANFKSGVLYNVIDRYDQKEVHQQYTSREAIEAAKAGKPLPAGTVITSANYKAVLDTEGNPIRDAKGNFVAGELDRVVVMEKRAGAGDAYPENLRNGDWEFAAFTADGKFNPQAPAPPVCMACHKPHERLDYVKTYFAMAGKRVETNPAPVPPGAVVATVVRFAVNPSRLIVHAGTPVTWINIDDVAHQFRLESTDVKTEYLLKGQTGTVVLKEPGTYRYGDTFYPATESLRGVIEVQKWSER
jgi:plastocyanin